MSSKQNKQQEYNRNTTTDSSTAQADIWEPDADVSDEDFSQRNQGEFHDDERIQFQREIMAAGNGSRMLGADDDDEEDEEDGLYEADGLLDTRNLIANNQGMLNNCFKTVVFKIIAVLQKNLFLTENLLT